MSGNLQLVLADTLARSAENSRDELEYLKATKGAQHAEVSYTQGWNDCLAYLAERTQTGPLPDTLELLAYRRAVTDAWKRGDGASAHWIQNRVKELIAEWAATKD